MKQKTFKIAVSEKEYELLEAIRNYNKSFPDGYPQYFGTRKNSSTKC